jgi:bifunctional enzyme CysN/CysC
MDLVGYDREHFARLEAEYREFLSRIGVEPEAVIPVVGRDGDNIARRAASLDWFHGPTVLEMLDRFPAAPAEVDRPFRMPVQDVYKFTGRNDDRRIVAGTVVSGSARVGDEVVFYPSGKRSAIKSFEAFNREPLREVGAGQAAGFTLREQIYVGRGELASIAGQPRPQVSSRLRVSVFWLGKSPLVQQKDYVLKMGSTRVHMRLEEVHRVIDASNLSGSNEKSMVERNEVAECTISCSRATAFDLADSIAATSRFVIVDAFEICGGGIVREALPDSQGPVREKVLLREYKWEPSFIGSDRRAARFAQKPTLLLITGAKDADRKRIARQLESRLFDEGRVVYFLGIGNVLYGVDSDIARDRENRHEHIRRLAEIANLMLDSGMILIVTAQELTREDLDLIKTTVPPDRIQTVWVGDLGESDLVCDLLLDHDSEEQAVDRVRGLLLEHGVIFQPQ